MRGLFYVAFQHHVACLIGIHHAASVETKPSVSKKMIGIGLALVFVYGVLILYYTFKFKSTLTYKKGMPQHSFSILIPFRNEEKHLPQLLRGLESIDYPSHLFEILLIDDHSEDQSNPICQVWKAEHSNLDVRILENQNQVKSPKKSAILTALKTVKNAYILTTDADCILPEEWLMQYDQFLQNTPSDLIAGPVKIIEDSLFWTKFQVLDMMSLQVIGLGSFNTKSPLFCNAANLCYKTQTLKEINAFDSHKDIISGDDVFNLEAFQNSGKTIKAIVNPNATVWTEPEINFKSLTQQRIRWASKAKYYNNNGLKVIGLFVFLTNLSLVLSMAIALIYSPFLELHLLLWILKLGVDFYALFVGNQFFKTNLCLREYLIMLVIYPFVSSYFALLSLNGKFNWKGRNFKA